jgi:hypothetical protein
VRRARVELTPAEGAWLRGVMLGEEERGEVRLLARVEGRRLVSAVRSDSGPLRQLPRDLDAEAPRALWSLPEARDVDRVVILDPAREGSGRPLDLLERLGDRGVVADPPWCAAFAVLRPLLERLGALLLEDGAYALASRPEGPTGWRVACARVRAGAIDRVSGASALGLDADAPVGDLLAAVRRRVGAPRLVVLGAPRALRVLAASRRPLTLLERAAIREDLEIACRSRRLSLALHAMRLVEPLLDRAPGRGRRRGGRPPTTSRA